MHHRRFLVAVVLLSGASYGLFAAEKPPADYQKAMKDLGAFAQSIDKAVADEAYEAIVKLAASAQADFVVAEAYWKGKAPDAFSAATSGEKFAVDLGAVAALKNKEGVEYAAKQVTGVCMGCHAAHRQAVSEGVFEIK